MDDERKHIVSTKLTDEEFKQFVDFCNEQGQKPYGMLRYLILDKFRVEALAKERAKAVERLHGGQQGGRGRQGGRSRK